MASVATEKLVKLVEEIQTLRDRQRHYGSLISEVKRRARMDGFDPKALTRTIQLIDMGLAQASEHLSLVEVYMAVLREPGPTPLEEAIAAVPPGPWSGPREEDVPIAWTADQIAALPIAAETRVVEEREEGDETDPVDTRVPTRGPDWAPPGARDPGGAPDDGPADPPPAKPRRREGVVRRPSGRPTVSRKRPGGSLSPDAA